MGGVQCREGRGAVGGRSRTAIDWTRMPNVRTWHNSALRRQRHDGGSLIASCHAIDDRQGHQESLVLAGRKSYRCPPSGYCTPNRHQATQRCSDLGLVSVHRGGIDVPVSGHERPAHRILGGTAAARLIDAEPPARHRDAVVELIFLSEAVMPKACQKQGG
jgi:hypothetical protein